MDKTLGGLGDKVLANDRANIESKVRDLREALKSEDTAHIKKLSEELQQAFYAISQQLYQQGQQASAAPGGNGHGPAAGTAPEANEEGVVDGEFREA